MTDDIALLPATTLLTRYRDRTLSPVEATRACLTRIARQNPILNAFCLVDEEGALAAAAASEARWAKGEPVGPVDGVPTSIKDLVLTRGWPTRRGSLTVDPAQPWTEDAPVTARLREAGAVLLGKTTTPEMGWKGVTHGPLTGITRNPWRPDTTPGGSSGGAAVAAAAGMAALNVGTDGGGSIRIPASFTGIVGFKPTYGRVPAWPLSPFGTISHLGPMTRTVGDAALMLEVIARPDRRDWTALPFPPEPWRELAEAGVEGLRIAFAPTLGEYVVDPEVAHLVGEAVADLGRAGARIVEAAPPLAGADASFFRHWAVGAATLLTLIPQERHALMDPGLLAMAKAGAAASALDFTAAIQARGRLGLAMNLFHEHHDLLVLPTMPIPAFAAGHDVPPDGPYAGWQAWTPFTYPFNLTQQPAISVPCGLTARGLPVGLQIVAAVHQDTLVLRAARTLEKIRPWPMPPAVA